MPPPTSQKNQTNFNNRQKYSHLTTPSKTPSKQNTTQPKKNLSLLEEKIKKLTETHLTSFTIISYSFDLMKYFCTELEQKTPSKPDERNRLNAVFPLCTILSSIVVCFFFFFFNTSALQMLELVFQMFQVIIFNVI